MAKKEVEVVVEPVVAEVVVAKKSCDNCNDSSKQCSVCTPVFVDTFGAN